MSKHSGGWFIILLFTGVIGIFAALFYMLLSGSDPRSKTLTTDTPQTTVTAPQVTTEAARAAEEEAAKARAEKWETRIAYTVIIGGGVVFIIFIFYAFHGYDYYRLPSRTEQELEKNRLELKHIRAELGKKK